MNIRLVVTMLLIILTLAGCGVKTSGEKGTVIIAAKEAMVNAKIYEIVKSKFIYGESISQTVSYAVNATDIGLIAASSVHSPHMNKYKENTNWKLVEDELYNPIEQGIVILKKSENDAEVKSFYNFMFSDKAKEILKEYGYGVRWVDFKQK